MLDDQLLISELAERAGVSVRTIRFYISEGLLPTPEAHGRYSVYDEEYLTRIELIKLLKSAYLPLKEIKRMVESLSKEEIESMLQKLSESTPTPPASQHAPSPTSTEVAPNSTGASPKNTGVRESGLPEALDYISRVLHTHALPVNDAASAVPPAPPSPVSRPLISRARANLREADTDAGQPEESESSWRHYTIQPGVELLVSEKIYNQTAPAVHRIVAQVKQLFSTHPSGGKNV